MKRSMLIALTAVLLLAALALPATAAVNDVVSRKFFDVSPGDRRIIASTTDGNGDVIVVGHEDEIIYVSKYLLGEDLAWKKLFGTAGVYTDVSDVAVDQKGFIYVTGTTEGDRYSSIGFIRKYGPKGGHHWTRRFGPEWSGTSIAKITLGPGGNIFVLGMTDGDFSDEARYRGLPSMFLRKYTPGGKFFWTKQFTGPKIKARWGVDRRMAIPVDIAVNAGGVYVLTTELDSGYYMENDRTAFKQDFFYGGGMFGMYPGSPDYYGNYNGGYGFFGEDEFFMEEMTGVTALKKFGHNGSLRWTKRFGKKRRLRATAMALDSSGDAIVAGDRRYGSFTAKFSKEGTRRWTRFWSGIRVADVTVDSGRNIYLTGTDNISRSSWGAPKAVYPKAYVGKLSSSGDHQWRRAFLNGHALGASVDANDNLYAFGYGTVLRKDFLVKFKN